MGYEVKDSGQRQEFTTGARRDTRTGKGRFDLISPRFLKRLAVVMEKGAEKYGDRNWEKGMPLGRLLDSALRHINQVLLGDQDEDHLAHASFNLMAAVHTAELVNEGERPASLDDIGYCEPRVKYPTTFPLQPDQLETVTERSRRREREARVVIRLYLGPDCTKDAWSIKNHCRQLGYSTEEAEAALRYLWHYGEVYQTQDPAVKGMDGHWYSSFRLREEDAQKVEENEPEPAPQEAPRHSADQDDNPESAEERESRVRGFIGETLAAAGGPLSSYDLCRRCIGGGVCSAASLWAGIEQLLGLGEIEYVGVSAAADGRSYPLFRLPQDASPEPAPQQAPRHVLQSVTDRERTLQALEDHIRTLLARGAMKWEDIVKDCELHDYKAYDVYPVAFDRIKLERAANIGRGYYRLPKQEIK